MSILSDFAKNASQSAFTMIGAESVTIGSTTISCVLNEIDQGRDMVEYGFEKTKRVQAVCRSEDMPSTSVLKKRATARGENFTVSEVQSGATFTTITLTSNTRA